MQAKVIDGMQETMHSIVKKVGSLTTVVDRIDGVQGYYIYKRLLP